jgi:hypothetical protein
MIGIRMDLIELLNILKEKPITYKTLFGEFYTDDTRYRVVRRKLNKEFMRGNVMRCIIPGSLFSKIMFFGIDKEYTIFFVVDGLQTQVIYSSDFSDDRFKIYIKTGFVLHHIDWRPISDVTISKAYVQRCF